MEINFIALAIPVFFACIGVEVWVAHRRNRTVYHFGDAINDLACGVSEQVVGIFFAALLLGMYVYAYEHWRLVTFGKGSLWPWLIAVLGVDVAYYWWHRLSHHVNFLWAVHVVHHSSEDYNLAVALRQAVLSDFTVSPFYLVLALAGVHPLAVMTVRSLSTLYQFWIHTELVGKLGALDRVINTPSAHRVHHAINARYIDRNFAAVFMFWDRLFGSYEPESEACVYGISKPVHSFNPLWAQLHYWVELWGMARTAPSLGEGVKVFFRSPGWVPPWAAPKKPLPSPLTPQTFQKYGVSPPPRVAQYVGVHFITAAVATFALLWWGDAWPTWMTAPMVALVLLSLVSWGGLLESRGWSSWVEPARLVLLALGAALWAWRGPSPLAGAVLLVLALGSLVAVTRLPRVLPLELT